MSNTMTINANPVYTCNITHVFECTGNQQAFPDYFLEAGQLAT